VNGTVLDDDAAGRIVALMRLNIEDSRLVDERVAPGRSISFGDGRGQGGAL